MRRRIQIYLDHAHHLTPDQRKWLRQAEAKRANDKKRLKEAKKIIRAELANPG